LRLVVDALHNFEARPESPLAIRFETISWV
jgi:hypothetical protein